MALKQHPGLQKTLGGPSFQDMLLDLSRFWAGQGAVLALPYDMEVGAGTMCPETFFRVLGPSPWSVAYAQPSRRPADGRYGENPNRLIKHTQFQVILKPPPDDVQDLYLKSLSALGIKLEDHDIRFEEDNWEAPTLGAWGIGWQVMLDGLEITQFTYFQQCGGIDLEPISCELTYGLERIAAFLQNVEDVFEVRWNDSVKYNVMRREEEYELSLYDFEMATPETCRKLFELYEGEALKLIEENQKAEVRSQKSGTGSEEFSDEAQGIKGHGPGTTDAPLITHHSPLVTVPGRFPLRKVYEFALKCSHLFNILDARGAISVTERVALIARVRKIACESARIYAGRLAPEREASPA